ncbi:hypothetical protein Ahy_B02g060549 [Arachis hypogaea]|uniref:SWIM-type domain-containing protein n=1 Tax=Arachis hypogaea TaxID=3818 RepID=A0A445AIV5_ARAHY|nr:hypothetical protein Ahy_B02g060549 [Arachis hypogaea]
MPSLKRRIGIFAGNSAGKSRRIAERQDSRHRCLSFVSFEVPLRSLSRVEPLNSGCWFWVFDLPGVPRLSWFVSLVFEKGGIWLLFIPILCSNIGMFDSELDLDDGSTSELSGHWTDDSEYKGKDGGGSNMHASAEDQANSENVMVQKGDSIKDEEGNIVRKIFYHNRQGLREKKHYERVDKKRTHKPEMRTNCNAKLVVFLEKSCRKWRTKTLVEEHNHELAPQEFTNVMAPHRKIPEGHKAHIHSMHEVGFQTTQIMDFFAHMCGGYRNLNFINCKTLYSNLVMTTGLETLERSVSKFYTREIFNEVQKQIEGVGALLVLHRDSIGGTEKFMFQKYRKPHHVYSVFMDRSCDKYECSCKLWERLRIPCCHIFCILKEPEKEDLPSRLVLRKWCKDAKVANSSSQHASVNPTDGFRVRYGALWSAYLSLCFTAAQCTETYNTAMTEVTRMSREFASLGGIGQRSSRVQAGADETHILDPKIIRSKGAPRGSTNANNGRRCRRCLGLGHDKRNCTATDDDVVDEDGGSDRRPVYNSGKRSRQN